MGQTESFPPYPWIAKNMDKSLKYSNAVPPLCVYQCACFKAFQEQNIIFFPFYIYPSLIRVGRSWGALKEGLFCPFILSGKCTKDEPHSC